MEKDYLDIVDEVVMKAFKDGVIVVSDELWNEYAIRHRLLLYGSIKDGYYSLNELGIRYVMDGCSEGIKRKQAKDEYIDDLNIEATQKAMNDADRAFVQSEKSLMQSMVSNKLAKWALGVSIFALICQMIEHILRGLL